MIEVKATPRFMGLAKKAMALEKYAGQPVKVVVNAVGLEFSIILMANILFCWLRCLKKQTKKISTLMKKQKCVS